MIIVVLLVMVVIPQFGKKEHNYQKELSQIAHQNTLLKMIIANVDQNQMLQAALQIQIVRFTLRTIVNFARQIV